MPQTEFHLGEIQKRRAELLGAEGQAWMDALPDLISDFESRWDIQLEKELAGGTEAQSNKKEDKQNILAPGLYMFQMRERHATCGDAKKTGNIRSFLSSIDGDLEHES